MTSSVSGFKTPFPVAGDLGVGTASILGGNAQTTQNAASILTTGQSATGPLAAIAKSLNTATTPTLAALETGALTTSQHNVLQTLDATPTTPISIPWNTDGSEPTTLAQMRSYGWIKLVKPTYDQSTKLVTSATYELTPVGKAIAARTGGGGVTATGVSVSA